jgi:hypothetical protein
MAMSGPSTTDKPINTEASAELADEPQKSYYPSTVKQVKTDEIAKIKAITKDDANYEFVLAPTDRGMIDRAGMFRFLERFNFKKPVAEPLAKAAHKKITTDNNKPENGN